MRLSRRAAGDPAAGICAAATHFIGFLLLSRPSVCGLWPKRGRFAPTPSGPDASRPMCSPQRSRGFRSRRATANSSLLEDLDARCSTENLEIKDTIALVSTWDAERPDQAPGKLRGISCRARARRLPTVTRSTRHLPRSPKADARRALAAACARRHAGTGITAHAGSQVRGTSILNADNVFISSTPRPTGHLYRLLNARAAGGGTAPGLPAALAHAAGLLDQRGDLSAEGCPLGRSQGDVAIDVNPRAEHSARGSGDAGLPLSAEA